MNGKELRRFIRDKNLTKIKYPDFSRKLEN